MLFSRMRCRPSSRRKKLLLLIASAALLVLLLCAACTASVLLLWNKSERLSRFFESLLMTNSTECDTKDCTSIVEDMASWLEVDADACESPVRFSCGHFPFQSSPDGRQIFSARQDARDRLDHHILDILKETLKESPYQHSDSLAKTAELYKLCEQTYERSFSGLGGLGLRSLLRRGGALGEWPLGAGSNFSDCRPDLEWRMAQLAARGQDSLVALRVAFGHYDLKLRATVRIADPVLSCGDASNEDEDEERARASVERALREMNAPTDNRTDEQVDALIVFDRRFCNATAELRERREAGISDSRYDLQDLANHVPEVNWVRWRHLLLESLGVGGHGLRFRLLDLHPPSLSALDLLLQDTPHRTVSDWLGWRAWCGAGALLGRELGGGDALKHHAPEPACAALASHLMPVAVLGRMRTLHAYAHEQVSYITTAVKTTLIAIINETFSGDDRTESARKVNRTQILIGYPKEKSEKAKSKAPLVVSKSGNSAPPDLQLLLNSLRINSKPIGCHGSTDKNDGGYVEDGFYDNFYSEMQPLEGLSLLEAGLEAEKFRLRKLLLGVQDSRTILSMQYAIQLLFDPFDWTSQSFPHKSTVVLSPGMVFSTIAHPNLPKFMTFSTIGWVIAKEILKEFDLESLSSGGSDWRRSQWSGAAQLKAQATRECFMDAASLNDTGNHMDLRDASEKYLDNQALHIAYLAYENYLNSNEEKAFETNIPYLPKNNKELFFLRHAQQFCEKRKEAGWSYQPNEDEPVWPLSSQQDFGHIFNCSWEGDSCPLLFQ